MESAAAPESSVVPLLRPALRLQALLDRALADALQRFARLALTPDQLAITLIDLKRSDLLECASHRGAERVYPASVVKSFYLRAAHRWMADGKLADTAELRRAMHDMIVHSYNEPTGYVLDLLTNTTSGPELSPEAFTAWFAKRNAVNRYFTNLGYERLNLNRKTWCEGPYGREQQLAHQPPPDHRNWLTSDATARLFAEMVLGYAVTPERSRQMLELHARRPFEPEADGQSREYTGAALPAGAKLWSKAGWMSEVRHDAAYVELPNGAKFVLVIFTTGHTKEKEIIPAIAKAIIAAMD